MPNRRDFIKTALAGGAAAGLSRLSLSAGEAPDPALRIIDRRPLGRTGVPVSILGLGLGSTFTRAFNTRREEGLALLEQALDMGINFWDTCRGYGPSEEMLGPIVEKHRERIFMVTKSGGRDYDRFMRDVETSLKNLRTDHLDLLHMWNLRGNDDLERMEKGCFKAMRELKDQKVVRHCGITGHSGADILCEAEKRFHPEAIMTVFPCTRDDHGKYEDKLLPQARERKTGMIAMKMVRHARGADLRGSDLIRYALSLEGMACAVVGVDTLAHLRENAAMATDFNPMPAKERAELHRVATGVLAGIPPPWEQAGYQDGALV